MTNKGSVIRICANMCKNCGNSEEAHILKEQGKLEVSNLNGSKICGKFKKKEKLT